MNKGDPLVSGSDVFSSEVNRILFGGGVDFSSVGGSPFIAGNHYPDRVQGVIFLADNSGRANGRNPVGFSVIDGIVVDIIKLNTDHKNANHLVGNAIHEALHESRLVSAEVEYRLGATLRSDKLSGLSAKTETALYRAVEEQLVRDIVRMVDDASDSFKIPKGYFSTLAGLISGKDGGGAYAVPGLSADQVAAIVAAYSAAGSFDAARAAKLLKQYVAAGVNIPGGGIEFLIDGRMLKAAVDGSSHRDDGSVEYWRSSEGSVAETREGSYYTDAMLDNYGRVDGAGYASMSFGGHLRAFGDLIGLDGEIGIQGTYAKPGEGSGSNDVSVHTGKVGTSDTSNNPFGGGSSDDRSSDGKSGNHLSNAGSSTSHQTLRPILLDLDNTGIQITELSRSPIFMDGGEGLLHRTAWAGAGDGVLFFDPDGRNAITEQRQYVFTEWDPTAKDDLAAVRAMFDSNGDGKLTSADADFAKFKVLVTNADGTTTVKTLAQLNITEINLTADTTRIELPDGSVITGQTTFKYSTGATGTVANTTLVAEADGHRVVQTTTTDGSGNTVVVSTGYAADGSVAFAMKSVTSPTGSAITNTYDDNGDGVTDRIQTITRVTNGNGSKTETEINKAGSDAGTAILVSRTVTTTSADGKVVTIERDQDGGGWFTEREVRTTNADGSRTKVVSELAQSGAVIRSTSETVSINGLTRVEGQDEDGNGTTDRTETHTISVAGNGVRTETTAITNGNASLRGSVTEVVSADGRTKTLSFDLDGSGTVDRKEETAITVSGSGTSSVMTVKNGDNSVRSSVTQTQSADALTKTSAADVDGDGDTDLTTVDVTVISGNGSRENTVTRTNTDGSIRGKEKVTLGADKVTSETWVDQNQDGTFQSTDLVKSVTVDAGTQARTETVWARNPDGTFSAKSVAVTSADGLTTNTTLDLDGDGDTDRSVSDVTVLSGGIATRTITESNQNASLHRKTEIVTSADGLTVTTRADIDGNGTWDGKTVDARVLNGDGSTTRTVSDYAGNGTTLIGRVTTAESADRRTVTVTTDANGDGATDRVVSSVEATDGSRTVTETIYAPNGAALGTSVSTFSANGLVVMTTQDRNADLVAETVTTDTTAIAPSGSRSRSLDVNNGDGSNRSLQVTTTSDDRLVTTVETDADGNNAFERTSTATTVLNANGSSTTTTVVTAQNAAVLGRSQVIVSDDGLVVTAKADADADGDYDLTTTTTTVLLNDGGTSVTRELRNLANVLREKTVTLTSDDGRSVTVSEDVNGDGQNDRVKSRVIANDGGLTVITSELSETGALISRARTTVSNDGLTTLRETDLDGDGQYERKTEEVTVRNADGSTTRTAIGKGYDASTYIASVVTISDDGLTTTRTDDVDGDGTMDLTTLSTVSLAANGVRTETVESRAEDTSLIDRRVVVTSADRRSVTESRDADGNGLNDRVTATITAATGQITATTDYLSSGGVVEARHVLSLSGDGLVRVETIDRNYDGRVDLRTTDVTDLGSDGSVSQRITHQNGRNVLLAAEERQVSDDGLTRMTRLDANGDRVFEVRNEEVTAFLADGTIETVRQTFNETSDLLWTLITQTSGDGLTTTSTGDGSVFVATSSTTYDGNIAGGTPNTVVGYGVSSDWRHTVVRTADGAMTETKQRFGAGEDLQSETITTISADGRTQTVLADLDGDGVFDRDMVSVIGLGRDQTAIYRDFKQNGETDQEVTHSTSADGLASSLAIDVDGDGQIDLVRSRSVTFASDGSEIVTTSELFGENPHGFLGVTTTSANGLLSTSEIDIEGDGIVDGTTLRRTSLNADGTRTMAATTTYANGELRSDFVTEISADGRTSIARLDYDGNGIADKVVETTVRADGTQIEVETAYDKGGMRGQVFTTVTSADGLQTSIARSGNEQTITRSALDNGTYTWNNGVKAGVGATNIVVAHAVDAFGIETWAMTSTWQYIYSWTTNGGETTITETRTGTSTITARLDPEAKAKILADAAQIYDTVLDRDMDFTEREQLVSFVKSGILSKASLVTSLIGTSEFTTRYGTLSNAEFVTQIWLNAVGRAPTLGELDTALNALGATAGTPLAKTRAEIALEVSDSVEHALVGNGHLATNNFDVILNPAQFERSLDVAYTRSLVEKLIDTMYDRDATEQELDYLSERLLLDVSNPDDLVALLRQQSGDIQGTPSATLKGLSGAALVEQAFLNAFGRQPSAQEQAIWEQNLSSGYISTDQFIASLAMSVEKSGVGSTHVATVAPASYTLIGTSAAETLTVTGTPPTDAQVLKGLGGNDTLQGGAGSDHYEWSIGHGNDLIDDTGTSQLNTDKLILTNVASTGVTLTRVAFTDDLRIDILATGEFIVIKNQMLSLTNAYGIEAIEFSDGVTWSLDQIKFKTTYEGVGTAENAGRGNYAEHLFGYGGNDTLNGSAGNDTLVGGADVDLLKGGDGSDTYTWTRGDGADTIEDNGLSTLDVDRLVLTNVASADAVTLHDIATNKDIIVRIGGVGGADILIKDRDYEVSGVRQGRGIEVIEFSDGVVWTLDEIFRRGSLVGDAGNQTYGGTAFDDHYVGLAGQDTLSGQGGADTLDGGTGNDSLVGGNGADTYLWRKGDGNDTINDSDTTTHETDVLVLDGITSDMVKLTRTSGSLHLTVTVAAQGSIPAEVISVLNRFNTGSNANSGIEEIRFSDGVIWSLADIWARTTVLGTGNAETLTGTDFIDNLFGEGGIDTINAGANDDLLVGGQGADVLDGAAGNDLFEWSTGDGNDALSDTSTSTTDVDTLALVNVASSAASLTKSGADLLVAVGAETITVKNRFNVNGDGRGVEILAFSDGVRMEVLAGPLAIVTTHGTTAAQTLTGWAFGDVQYGYEGADTLDGKAGDDLLIGGDGNDSLKGGDGADTYVWARGEDNDTLDDDGNSRTDVDTLVLTDVASTEVNLLRKIGATAGADRFDLRILITATGEELLIVDQYRNSAEGDGIEAIQFADGVIWTLDDIQSRTKFDGTSGNDTLDTTDANTYRELMMGYAGNDTLYTGNGDDTLIGGAGADSLWGEGNADTYIWSVGDGNDTINDNATSLVDTDTLVLTDVLPAQVALTHASGSNNLVITIGSEVITVLNRFSSTASSFGIERIEFSDGTAWTLDDILAQTRMNGTTGNETLAGSAYADNIFGLSGNDTLNAGDGNDSLTGGSGADSLAGGNGSDTYTWSTADGNDTLNDTGTAFGEIDRLVLSNVASTEIGTTANLTRATGSSNVVLTIIGTVTETITLTNQMNSTGNAYGVESILFSDGVVWTFDDILDFTKVLGTGTANTLAGTSFRDNLFGLGGNDTLTGSNGDDKLVGGTGADSLSGGSGVDTASYVDATQGVRVDLTVATGQTGIAGGEEVGDILVGIEALEGSGFADTLFGNAESNDLRGLAGNDSLKGGDGYDRLYGGDGADTLDGGVGADLLVGGAGADVFRFVDAVFGTDEIEDFVDGSDKISFSLALADSFSDLTITGNGTDQIDIALLGQTITLRSASAVTLAADDFLFA